MRSLQDGDSEMVTMADVAAKAAVSVSTVSHVINGTRAVAKHTRQAVLSAISELGYTPNTLARALATARSGLIGLAVSSTSNPYFTGLVHEIEAELTDLGYVLIVVDPREEPNHELQVVRALQERRRVDGLMLAPGPASQALRFLASKAVPTVLIDRLASAQFDQVGVENVEATATLVEHLAEQGHSRIGFIAGQAGLTTTDERIAGYRLGLANADLDYVPELEVGVRPGLDATQAVRRLWAGDDPPSGLVVGNDQMTIQALRGVRELGLAVPEDVALASFDDFEWADLFHPRLTTMAQPIADIAREAVRLLLSRIATPTLAPRTVRFPAAFMDRESCGCAVAPLAEPVG